MKILVADDEPVARTLFTHWLKSWGYEVVTVTDGQSALQALEADPEIRLAVLDWMMPERSGPEVVQALRQRADDQYVYVILITARQDTTDVVEGLDSGADDYIVKPCNPLELKVRLRAGRRIVELQQQLVSAREALRFEAMHDVLTGLMNRRATLRTLDQELARAQRTGDPLSVMMVDLDHFKAVNDRYGHPGGDAVLVKAAQRFLSCFRSYDHVGRVGGEEFLIILPGCARKDAPNVAERLRRSIHAGPAATANGDIPFTASIGIASISDLAGADASALLAAADAALYRAKRRGRDRAELASLEDFGFVSSEARPALAG